MCIKQNTLEQNYFYHGTKHGLFDSICDFSSSKKCQGNLLKVVIIITFIAILIPKKYLDLSKPWTLNNYILHYSDSGFGPVSDIEEGYVLKFLFWSFSISGLFLITLQMLTHLSLIAPLWHILLTFWGVG